MINNPAYGPLRELLKRDVREKIERPTTHIIINLNSSKRNPDQDLLSKEIARIEKEWGLI
jgi:hypothetical protein